MMRLGDFRYHVARDAAEAAAVLAGEERAVLLAGGTDLVPNMKRRQQTPEVLVSLRRADDLRGIAVNGEMTIGAATTIAEIVRSATPNRALFRAAAQVATPLIRNTATIGGNLCLDTRCNYVNQSFEWRRAVGFCKKAPCVTPKRSEGPGGASTLPPRSLAEPALEGLGMTNDDTTCWVAPSSPRCWAVSSSDLAPALIATGARVTLRSVGGEREIPLEALYADDGIDYLTKRRDEVLTSIRVPAQETRSTYWKLRRRDSFDFPVLGVAASIRIEQGVVEGARVVLGAVASRPLLLDESTMLVGRELTDDVIAEFAEKAAAHAKPLDNTDFTMTWRKAVAKTFLAGVLRELRGDDPAAFPLLMREAWRMR
jgi:4-hydroxybenzoyl-CoA reductase subunit beta